MVIRSLTPKAIWPYQAYSTTTCSSPMNSIHSPTHSLLALFLTLYRDAGVLSTKWSVKGKITRFCLRIWWFLYVFVVFQPTQHPAFHWIGLLLFTIPSVYWAVMEKGSLSFQNYTYFSSDWENVCFPTPHGFWEKIPLVRVIAWYHLWRTLAAELKILLDTQNIDILLAESEMHFFFSEDEFITRCKFVPQGFELFLDI